jgi:phosphatidylinositol glycan class Z
MIAHSMKRSSETIYLQSMVDEAYEKADTPREKVDIVKRKKLIPPHDFKFALPISILCAVGFFNRPTFVVFAMIPLFYWFQRGVFTHSYITPFQMFNFRYIFISSLNFDLIFLNIIISFNY